MKIITSIDLRRMGLRNVVGVISGPVIIVNETPMLAKCYKYDNEEDLSSATWFNDARFGDAYVFIYDFEEDRTDILNKADPLDGLYLRLYAPTPNRDSLQDCESVDCCVKSVEELLLEKGQK